MLDRDEMKSRLREGVCNVTFTKVNGETRVMKCTLNESIVPLATEAEIAKPRKENDSIVAAWDLDKQDWRSFRVDSVVAFEAEPTA
jgi:hypothetical protein